MASLHFFMCVWLEHLAKCGANGEKIVTTWLFLRSDKTFRVGFLTFAAYKISEQDVSPWPERRATQKLTTMKTDNKTPMRDLEYQFKRYQTMGNGAACQQLRNELQRRNGKEA